MFDACDILNWCYNIEKPVLCFVGHKKATKKLLTTVQTIVKRFTVLCMYFITIIMRAEEGRSCKIDDIHLKIAILCRFSCALVQHRRKFVSYPVMHRMFLRLSLKPCHSVSIIFLQKNYISCFIFIILNMSSSPGNWQKLCICILPVFRRIQFWFQVHNEECRAHCFHIFR